MKREESLSVVAFIALFFILLFFVFNNNIFIYISLLFLFFVAFPFQITDFIAKYWINIGKFIGNINSKIILFLTFFIFITPIAILFRLFNKKAVDGFKKENTDSMFVSTNRDFDKKSFEKPF
jgi:hypothetical protein